MTISILSLAYLIGSIPFGVIISNMAGIGDLRSQGSGNIGATNMVRVGGKKLGVFVLIADALKGVIAVLLARYFCEPQYAYIAALLAVIGHCYSLWLKFRGGKGVATSFGAITCAYWPVGVIAIAAWIASFIITRISSLSALIAMLAIVLSSLIPFAILKSVSFIAIALIVIIRHHENIKRLVNGSEK